MNTLATNAVQSDNPPATSNRPRRLSYKFERLRERVRQAIVSGELTGKLPGERILARRFHANAKTLSKALTDLAAEGLLDRSIGRGTYVKGSEPESGGEISSGKWMLLCDDASTDSPIVQQILGGHCESQIVLQHSATPMRPSFVNQFCVVIDLATSTPDEFLRDMVVRNIPVIAVGHEPRTYSTHAVVFDSAQALACLGRDLALAGHQRVAVVQSRHTIEAAICLRAAAGRYAQNLVVEACYPHDIPTMLDHGMTAIVCDSVESARQVERTLEQIHSANPNAPAVSLCAIGCLSDEASAPCSGYFVRASQVANEVHRIASDTSTRRPATVWLAGAFVDRRTIASRANAIDNQQPALRFNGIAV